MPDNKANHYMIKNIEDFFNVPQEKLLNCLEDLYIWITFVRKFNNAIEHTFGGEIEKTMFEWICDDTNDLYIKTKKMDLN